MRPVLTSISRTVNILACSHYIVSYQKSLKEKEQELTIKRPGFFNISETKFIMLSQGIHDFTETWKWNFHWEFCVPTDIVNSIFTFYVLLYQNSCSLQTFLALKTKLLEICISFIIYKQNSIFDIQNSQIKIH